MYLHVFEITVQRVLHNLLAKKFFLFFVKFLVLKVEIKGNMISLQVSFLLLITVVAFILANPVCDLGILDFFFAFSLLVIMQKGKPLNHTSI